MNGLCESTLQAGIRIDEVMHLVCITCNNTDKLSTVVLQSFQQRVYCFCAKRVAIIRLQGIGLVNEQYSTHGRVYQLVGLDGGLSTIASH